MKLKKEYLILLVLIAVLLLYLTVRTTNRNGEIFPQPAKLEKTDINRLVLTYKQNDALELVKKDDRWLIEPHGYPVDSVRVKNMLHSISELTLSAVVSESGNYDRYGLGAGEKINVQAFRGNETVRGFSVGKTAPTFQHTFVVLEGDQRVYHARGQLERTFEQSVDSLRDKTIFDFDKDTITAMSLTSKGNTLILHKQEVERAETSPEEGREDETDLRAPVAEWTAVDGRPIDQASVERLLEQIDHLDCDAFLEDDAAQNLKDTLWSITFKQDEEEFSFTVYPKLEESADKVPATASTTPYAFVMHEPRLDNIERHLNALLGIENED
jgi:hypothetical protein